MTRDQIALVQNSWRRVVPISNITAELFYKELFRLDPSLKALFRGDMREQGRKLVAMISTLAQGLGDGFTPEVKAAWAEAYGLLANTMKDAAAAA
jgi:hemoglobin-like flavoprotein